MKRLYLLNTLAMLIAFALACHASAQSEFRWMAEFATVGTLNGLMAIILQERYGA